MQGLRSEAPSFPRPQGIPTTAAVVRQTPLPSPFMQSVNNTVDSFPAAAVAIPVRAANSPRMAHQSDSAPTAAVKSLSFTDLQQDRQISPPLIAQSSSVSVHKPKQRSIEDLCFKAAALGISETGKASVAELEHECHSSSSDNSSVHALEVCLILVLHLSMSRTYTTLLQLRALHQQLYQSCTAFCTSSWQYRESSFKFPWYIC